MSFAEGASGWSLRRRLLLRLLLVVGLMWIANALLAIYSARRTSIEALDDNLHRAASLLMAFAEHEYSETAGRTLAGVEASDELPRGGYLYQIWSREGSLLLRSEGAPLAAIGAADENPTNIQHEGEEWRLISVWNTQANLHLLFAEPLKQRKHILSELSLALLLPMLLVLPALALLMLAALERGLHSSQAAAESLARRGADDFTSVPLNQFPRELRALVGAFNTLLLQLQGALQNERQFAQDVAHELRTPLAAIRLQAQTAQRAPDMDASQQSLDRLVTGVNRAARLVDQLLTLARLDPSRSADQDLEDFSLQRIVDEVVDELEQTVALRGLSLHMNVQDITVRSSPHAVYVVLKNLLENALRYSPSGSRVRLIAGTADGDLVLVVVDEGPGISVADRARVLERFTRLESNSAGSGLGLFIVRRIAETAGGSVVIDDGEHGGCRFTVRWPVAVVSP